MKIYFVLLLLLAWNPIHAQSSKKISTLDFVEILNNNREEALFYYENNWMVLRKMAVSKDYIASYELLEAQPDEELTFHLILKTTYTDKEQFEKSEERFAELIEIRGLLRLLNEKEPKDFRKVVFTSDFLHLE